MNLETNFDAATFLLPLLKIIWINILLSGDNAVVIALACRGLPAESRKWGIVLGAGVAIVMRIGFTAIVATLMSWPYLKGIGGVLLLWIAVQLVVENTDEKEIQHSDTQARRQFRTTFWMAILTKKIFHQRNGKTLRTSKEMQMPCEF